MSINREAIRRATMAVAMEDYYGLSEILWHLRSNYMATATEDELIHEAREIVRSLIKDGSVRLVRFRMTPTDAWPIDPAEIDQILQATESWRPPPSWDQPYPALGTDLGDVR